MSSQRTPSSTFDADLLLSMAKRSTARTLHRRPDEAGPARPPKQPTPEPAPTTTT
ncbi:hypothetical protein ACFWJ4_16460 [Kitasatospora sp. NPDC127067]|uniref:hypothetical protein n=1 Tax=Kitasatospora sp. NPDC127067 TaxID=3347126 RepID=UPI0036697CEC